MTDKKKKEQEGEEHSFFSHLEELRSRLIKCALSIGLSFVVCYHYSAFFLRIVQHPLKDAMPAGSSLTLLSLTEGFMTEFKVAILAAVFFACPLCFYQLWKFVAPALYGKERRYVWMFVPMATFFFLLGAAFNYFVTLPFAVKFLLSYAGPEAQLDVPLTATLSLGAYVSFFINMTLAFGLVFELPVLALLLGRMGLINYRTLTRGRRFALLAIFILAAFLTPTPDAFNQLLMALPLWVLYEISIVLLYFLGPKPPPEEPDEEEGGEEENEPGPDIPKA
jgi:sec-independent protein translocase protein TatC